MSSYIMVPVREQLLPEVFSLLAHIEGRSDTAAGVATKAPVVVSGGVSAAESWPEFAEMAEDDIRRAYRESWEGGRQRTLWVFLAQRPDEEFRYSEVCEELGWGRRELPATLGAYGRRSKKRYGGQRPHHVRQDEYGDWVIWMDARVAAIIREEAGV